MDEFTSRIEELNSTASLQHLVMRAEACNASVPTSLFVSGTDNVSSTGSFLPNSLSSSQLAKESPFMEETTVIWEQILLVARGERQIMLQIDNLSNLMHEYFGERSH